MQRARLFVIFVVAISSYVLGQDRALISGDAEDRHDIPVTGATVTLKNDSLGIERTTITNSDGMYFFAEVVPAEGYVVEVTAPGLSFAPPRLRFDVEVGETRHLLPSFIGDKASPSSSSLSRQPMTYQGFSSTAVEIGSRESHFDPRRSSRAFILPNIAHAFCPTDCFSGSGNSAGLAFDCRLLPNQAQ